MAHRKFASGRGFSLEELAVSIKIPTAVNIAKMKTMASGPWINLDDLYRHKETHPTFDAEALRKWLVQGNRWRAFQCVADANVAFKRSLKNRRCGFGWAK